MLAKYRCESVRSNVPELLSWEEVSAIAGKQSLQSIRADRHTIEQTRHWRPTSLWT